MNEAHEQVKERLAKTPAGAALLKALDTENQDLSKLRLPPEPPKPVRYAIEGDMHLVAELQKMVADTELHPGLKSWLKDELAAIKTNGAEVHLHLVDHGNGDVSLQAHIKGVHLGSRKAVKPVMSDE